jgi:hypothetical protein
MGVWGSCPFDNDRASDLVADLMGPINKVLELPIDVPLKRTRGKRFRSRASDHYFEARAAASLVLLAHGTDVLGGPPLTQILEALQKMRSDEEWLDQWDEGRRRSRFSWELRCSIDSQIRAVQRKLRVCCRKRGKSVRRRGRVVGR